MQELASLRYFTCPKGGQHLGECLNRICVSKQCQSPGMICVICEQLQHKKHDTMPLKYFMQTIMDSVRNKGSASLVPVATIEKLHYSIKAMLSAKRTEVQGSFQQIQNQITKYFDRVGEMVTGLLHSQGNMEKVIQDMLQHNQDKLSSLMGRVKDILEVIDIKQNKQFSVAQYVENLVKNIQVKQDTFQVGLTKLVNQVGTITNSITSVFDGNTLSQNTSVGYQWSPTLKGSKIVITDLTAQQSGMESSGQRFILMEKDLSSNLGRKVWGIKIKKFGGWIGIGVSLRNLIKAANFNFNYTTLGHGSYLISTNGYSWSHSIKEQNSAFKCFTFAVGDTVYIQFDPVGLKIRFRKNQSKDPKDTFQLPILAAPPGDSYCPSANLCSTNDSVQIVCVKRTQL